MTKVLIEFTLAKTPEESLLKRIAGAHGLYGLFRLLLSPSMDRLSVEYDASRLSGEQVESMLRRLGLPLRRAA